MTRDEQEMALWRESYSASRLIARADREAEADAAVSAFRKRYPPQPSATPATTPAAVWYDKPPFEKDERHHWCWVAGESHVQSVYWSIAAGGWRYCQPHASGPYPLNRRRVSPITKPPEPTT